MQELNTKNKVKSNSTVIFPWDRSKFFDGTKLYKNLAIIQGITPPFNKTKCYILNQIKILFHTLERKRRFSEM